MVQSPWLWAYWPRRMEVREGQHRGVVTKARSYVVPRSTSRDWTFGISEIEAASWSSVSTSSMFGLPWVWETASFGTSFAPASRHMTMTGSSIHARFSIPLQAPVFGPPRTGAVYQQGNSRFITESIPRLGAAGALPGLCLGAACVE